MRRDYYVPAGRRCGACGGSVLAFQEITLAQCVQTVHRCLQCNRAVAEAMPETIQQTLDAPQQMREPAYRGMKI